LVRILFFASVFTVLSKSKVMLILCLPTKALTVAHEMRRTTSRVCIVRAANRKKDLIHHDGDSVVSYK
jgi:hypothetical protein